MFHSILAVDGSVTTTSFLICTLAALFFGFLISLLYLSSGRCTKNFAITLVILPTLVQMVIFMVNGNLGTGIAVLGAFSLVRFRSLPGTSKEISCIFFAMAVGLAMGMGQLLFAAVLVAVIGLTLFLLERSVFGERKVQERNLKITIPENLDYTNVFDDLLAQYTDKFLLNRIKTTNLGSLIELDYDIALKDIQKEKEFLDQLRCRNGNLTIICSRVQNELTQL